MSVQRRARRRSQWSQSGKFHFLTFDHHVVFKCTRRRVFRTLSATVWTTGPSKRALLDPEAFAGAFLQADFEITRVSQGCTELENGIDSANRTALTATPQIDFLHPENVYTWEDLGQRGCPRRGAHFAILPELGRSFVYSDFTSRPWYVYDRSTCSYGHRLQRAGMIVTPRLGFTHIKTFTH